MYLTTRDFDLKLAQFLPFSGYRFDAALEDKIGLHENQDGRYSVDSTTTRHTKLPILFAYALTDEDLDNPSQYVLNPELFEVKYFIDEKEVQRRDLHFMSHTLSWLEMDAQKGMLWAIKDGYKPNLKSEEFIYDPVLGRVSVNITSKAL